MSIPLYGTIPDPLNGDAFYILKEERLSEHVWRYKGRIGFGETAEAFVARMLEEGTAEEIDTTTFQDGYCIPYKSYDMTDIQFLYDTEKNEVRMEVSLRGQMYAPEAAAIPHNLVFVLPSLEELAARVRTKYQEVVPPLGDEDLQEMMLDLQERAADFNESSNDSYLYFRCPRSKDGVALTRAMAHLLVGKPAFQILYPLLLDT